MVKLNLAAVASSYSAQDGEETIAIGLDGGKSRYRRDIANATSRVNVTWITGKYGFKTIRSLYKAVTESGSLPFQIDLILDEYTLTEHTVHFVPNSLSLSSIQGLTYTITAQLEVKPLPLDGDETDEFSFFNDMGTNPFYSESLFNNIMNSYIPDTMS